MKTLTWDYIKSSKSKRVCEAVAIVGGCVKNVKFVVDKDKQFPGYFQLGVEFTFEYGKPYKRAIAADNDVERLMEEAGREFDRMAMVGGK